MKPWYYRIEIADGTFTSGGPQPTLALCRKFFPRIEKGGLRCLDIGTQEFVAAVLFQRQGAAEVVAYDRLRMEDRQQVVAGAYGASFHYAAGLPLSDLKKHLRDHRIGTVFDFVNFSGVLYHMVDPLPGLAMARSFLRTGGLMLVESSVSLDPGFVAHVNHAGKLYPGSNYFQVSLEVLDYWIRMLRMRIVDAGFLWEGGPIARAVAVCRAVAGPVAEPDDLWMRKRFLERDFAPFGLDYAELDSDAPPVRYRAGATRHVWRAGLDSVDLYQSYRQNGAEPIDLNLAELRLKDVA